MTDVAEFLKWFHVDEWAVVSAGERIGTAAGATREPPVGQALLVDVDVASGLQRIALPFDAIADVDGHARTILVAAPPDVVRTAPRYDPDWEAPDERYLERVRSHLRR